MRLILLVAIAACATMGTALATGDPHTVYGKLANPDGTAPAASVVSFKAYIASRPGEVLTEKSPGCEYVDGSYQITVANFPTKWEIGDLIKLDFSNKATGTSCVAEQKLTAEDPEMITDAMLK